MKRNYFVTLLMTFSIIFGYAQQDVFSRDAVTTGNFGDAQLPWFYPIGGDQGDPDNNGTVRNFVKIGHNNNTTMFTNGRFYLVGSLDFEAAATSPRTINSSGGGGLSASLGIFNASSATHTINTPFGIDGATVNLAANSTGGLNFNSDIFINNNTVQFGGSGTGQITVNGVMQGTGNVSKTGNNTVEITANNTYSGDTFIDGGTLRVSSSGNLGTNADVFIGSSGLFIIDSDLTVETVQESGSGDSGVISVSSGATLTLNGNNKGTIFQNDIDGLGNIVIETTGTTELNLFGSNFIEGTVTVKNGSTLKIIAGNGFPNADVVVESGGTIILEGSSFYEFNSLNVNSGGTLTMNGTTENLAITGDVINDGTINLSTTAGSNLTITESLVQNGTLNTNGRTLRMVANNTQSISGTNDPIVLDDLFISKSPSATLTIEQNLDIANNLTINNGDVDVNPGISISVDGTFDRGTGPTSSFTLGSTSTTYSSLIAGSATGNDITYSRFVNSNANGNDLVSPPVDAQSWSNFLSNNTAALFNDGGTTYAFGPFNKLTGDYQNYNNGTSATLTSGVGYRAATNSGETLAFTGSVRTDDVGVSIDNIGPSFAEWNLVGNPYPSYVDAAQFLTANIGIFDPGTAGIWGYDGDASNGWTVVNLATVGANPLIAPGQGFFVSTPGLNLMQFDADWRTTGTSDDYIVGRRGGLVYMTIALDSATSDYTTDVYFNPVATLGFDVGFDAEFFATAPPFSIYTLLVEGDMGEPISLQAINSSDLADTTIPVGINAPAGEQVTVSLDVNMLPPSTEVFFEDTQEGITTLLNTSDYVFTPATTLSGGGRFFLRVNDDTLSDVENTIEDPITILSLQGEKKLVVNGILSNNNLMELYDLQGRLVLSQTLDHTATRNQIDVASLSSGVYVINLQSGSQQKSQKLIIN